MQMINIGTSKLYPWGWRLSLGLCMVPATTLLLGGIFLDDTPNSLCERGHPEEVAPPIPLQLHKPARIAGSLSVHNRSSARIILIPGCQACVRTAAIARRGAPDRGHLLALSCRISTGWAHATGPLTRALWQDASSRSCPVILACFFK